jgi:hypothetical protein
MKRERKEKKNSRDRSKLQLRHHSDHKKNLDEINLIITSKVTNNNWNWPYSLPKDK